jgi:SAM-dependent MidA family methyltransferase
MQIRGFLLEHQVEERIDFCHKWVLLDSTRQCKHIGPLARIIEKEIARSGVISFARYMELALYNRDHGYYRKSHIGKAGDFFTSISVGPLFGQMLAYFLAKQLAAIEGQLHIAEAGANDGALAADILSWLAQNRPQIAEKLQYFIVEPIDELQERQREKIRQVGRVAPRAPLSMKWVHSLEDLPSISGAIISNELLDAFPVHVFRWHRAENRWREYGVDAEFTFTPLSTVPDWAIESLAELKPLEQYLPDQFAVEFSPAAEKWWRGAAEKLNAGFLITFDYGDESTALWSPSRANGTLRAYRNHRLVKDVLADPGEQDITASVNFTHLCRAGEAAGLKSEPLQTQSQFLTKIAAEFFTNPTATNVRQFQTLTHPDHLGRSFKVLVQSRTNS